MVPVRPPALARLLLPGVLWRMPSQERTVHLTFDDGPTPGVTAWVLDTLAAHDAKATFFLLGANAERHPDLVRRIRGAGHVTGNHTYSHLNGWRTGLKAYLADAERAQPHTGSSLFRPPYGRITQAQAAALSQRFTVVMWDVLSKDYDRSRTPERCLSDVLRHARPGSIIVFHDSLKAEPLLRAVLPETLRRLSEEGYSFAALPSDGITPARR